MLLEPAPPIVHLLRRVIQAEERQGDHMGGGATAAVQYTETSERYLGEHSVDVKKDVIIKHLKRCCHSKNYSINLVSGRKLSIDKLLMRISINY